MTKTFIRITNEDVYNEIKKLGKSTSIILEHSKKTDNHLSELNHKIIKQEKKIEENKKELEETKRVSLENAKRSIGRWIGEHPYRFTVFVMGFTALVISDLRHPIWGFFIKVFF